MQNLFMQFSIRAICLFLLWPAYVQADSFTITRIGRCDWTCNDSNFVQLSCHQRQDKAIAACVNRSLIDGLEYIVTAAQYRVLATIDDPPTVSEIGSVTLSWKPPVQNTDGTPLTDLTSYKFYYGNVSGDYPNIRELLNPNVSSYVIDNLVLGTYFFVGTVINSQGIESDFSNEAMKLAE